MTTHSPLRPERVGVITRGGHGPSQVDDDTNVVAVVVCGDDSAGGWCSGALAPDATLGDAFTLRVSGRDHNPQQLVRIALICGLVAAQPGRNCSYLPGSLRLL
jgi:hypothetical protein